MTRWILPLLFLFNAEYFLSIFKKLVLSQEVSQLIDHGSWLISLSDLYISAPLRIQNTTPWIYFPRHLWWSKLGKCWVKNSNGIFFNLLIYSRSIFLVPTLPWLVQIDYSLRVIRNKSGQWCRECWLILKWQRPLNSRLKN